MDKSRVVFVSARPTITESDIDFLDKATDRAGIDGEVVFAVEDEKASNKPSMKQIRAERDRVLAAIADAKPDFVVALGPVPIESLWNIGSGLRVADMRRKPHEVEGISVPVWVTYSLEEASFKQGLLKWIALDLTSMAKGKFSTYKMGDYVVQQEMHPDLRAYLEGPGPHILSWDLETYPAFDPWHPNARIRMCVLTHRTGWAQVIPANPDSSFPQWVHDIVSSETIWKVGSNPKFDMLWERRFGVVPRRIACTATLEHVLDENSPQRDLKTLTLIYHPTLGDYAAPMDELKRERGGMEFLTDEEMYQYCGGDGDAGITIFPIQIKHAAERDLDYMYSNVMMPFYETLSDIEYNGACIDEEENKRLAQVYEEELSALRMQIAEHLGPINPRSKPQLMDALKREIPDINLLLKENDDTSDEVTRKFVLQREASKHPVLPLILDFRWRDALYRTFVKGLAKHWTRQHNGLFIRSTYRMDRAVTYRLTSKNPNLQNIPRNQKGDRAHLNIKNQYISRWRDIGGEIMEFDESQAELREACMVTEDDVMRAAFEAGGDYHREVAALMHGVPLEEVTEELRQGTKTTGFRVFYGGGAKGLAQVLGIMRWEAQELIDAYFAQMERTKEWMDEQREKVRRDLYVRSRWKLMRRFQAPERWHTPAGWRIERQAINGPIQLGAAWLTNCAIHGMRLEMQQCKLRSKIILTVHDSAVVDVYPGEREAVYEIGKRHFEHPSVPSFIDLTVPLVGDAKVGASWGTAVAYEG